MALGITIIIYLKSIKKLYFLREGQIVSYEVAQSVRTYLQFTKLKLVF